MHGEQQYAKTLANGTGITALKITTDVSTLDRKKKNRVRLMRKNVFESSGVKICSFFLVFFFFYVYFRLSYEHVNLYRIKMMRTTFFSLFFSFVDRKTVYVYGFRPVCRTITLNGTTNTVLQVG